MVWEALCEYIKNPELILEYLEKTHRNVKKNETLIQQELNEIESKLHKLDIAEEQIIKAFREEVISMKQLKAQIADINETKRVLTEEKQKLREEQITNSPVVFPKSLKSALKILSRNLNNCDFEMKQKIVRAFIKEIIIKDNEIEIESCIPSNLELNSEAPTCSIASAPSLYRGYNPALSFSIIKQKFVRILPLLLTRPLLYSNIRM